MRKLAVLRDNESNPCPFGLSIPEACQNVGEAILKMMPIKNSKSANEPKLSEQEQKEIEQYNQQVYHWEGNNQPCPYAGKQIKKFIDCTYGTFAEGNPSKTSLEGSPFYVHMMSGIGQDGLYTVPLGYYADNSIDRGYYYGMYSVESIANQKPQELMKPANNLEYQSKVTSFDKGLEMSVKTAQSMGSEGLRFSPEELREFLAQEDSSDLRVDVELSPEDHGEEEALQEGGEVEGEIAVELDNGEEVSKKFEFKLPEVPGGDDQGDIDVPVEEIEVQNNSWKYTSKNFVEWLYQKLNNIPKHSGKDTVGIERAISYLMKLDSEISTAVRKDYDNEIDVSAIEKAREEIKDGIERLEQRLAKINATKFPKKKKTSDHSSDEIVKEAQKAGGFQVNVPLFISHVARTCINSTVSGGHDLQDVFQKMIKKYALSDREQAETFQLLHDMGYAVRWDRMFKLNEEIDPTSSDNGDWNANYPA